MVAGAALAAGLMSPASAEEPVDAPETSTSEDSASNPTTTADTAIEAQVAARSQGTRVEVLSERTESSVTFAEPDGSFTSEISAGVERVRDTSGDNGWRDIDLTLRATDGAVQPVSPLHDLTLNGGSADAPLVELASGDASIGFDWTGAELPEPVLDGPRATYADVEENVDLVVEATRYGFEHYLILKEKPADTSKAAIELPVVSEGLSFAETDGAVDVVDADGDRVGQLGTAFMWGSDGEPVEGAAHTTVPVDAASLDVAAVSVEESGGDQTLIVDPGEEFLEDATYPVTIDPSVTFGSPADTYVTTAYPNNNYASATELMFGTYDSGAEKYRTFLRFAGQPIAGAQIQSASLQLYGHKSYNCNASEFVVRSADESIANSDITWNKQPGASSSVYATINAGGKGGGSACPAGWISAGNVKNIVQSAADRGKTTFAMRVTASETSNLQWRRVSSANGANPPKLVVNFNRHPGTPSAPAISASTVSGTTRTVGTLTPSFSSKAVDPDGGTLNYTFEVYKSSTISAANLVTSCSKSGASGTTVACSAPGGKLTNNTAYWVRVVARDGVAGSNPSNSSTTAFKTMVIAAPVADVTETDGGGFFAPVSGRILDTRNGTGGYTTPMAANIWRTIPVVGQGGVPDDDTISAVAVTATMTQISSGGALRGRASVDGASNELGRYGGVDLLTTSVPAIVPVSADGTIELLTSSQTDMVLDVRGYYSAQNVDLPLGFVPVKGARIFDTLNRLDGQHTPLASGEQVDIQVASRGTRVPSSAYAVLVNVTTSDSSGNGVLNAFPVGGVASGSLHYVRGTDTTLQTPVELSSSGAISIRNTGATTDLVVEVQGYYTAVDETAAFLESAAGRIYDTRAPGFTKFGDAETRTIQVAGELGVPPAGSGITAVTVTLTSTGGEGGSTRATTWSTGDADSITTSLSLGAGTLRSNTITVGLDEDGAFKLRNVGSPANYIIDMQGWYVTPSQESLSCVEDLTIYDRPGTNTGLAAECSSITEGSPSEGSPSEEALVAEETFVGEEGDAFWVDSDDAGTERTTPKPLVVLEDTSSARSQEGSSIQSNSDLDALIDEAGFCEPELDTVIEDALAACAASPQSAPDLEEGPADGEEMSATAASSSDPCAAATSEIRYITRTRACWNHIEPVIMVRGKKVVGTFRVQMISRTLAASNAGSIDNTISYNLTQEKGEAIGKPITIRGKYECNSTVCSGQTGYFTEVGTKRWTSRTGTSTVKLAYKEKAEVSEGWRFDIKPPGFSTGSVWSIASRPRCDNKVVGDMGTGCVFAKVRPIWGVATSGDTAEVGRHLRKAISSGLPTTLTRTEPANKRANYRKACPGDIKRPEGYQCDEYPFQSTRQGAASGGSARVFDGCKMTKIAGVGRSGWSRCMVEKRDNLKAGTYLGVFYRKNRVLPGDQFGVRVK